LKGREKMGIKTWFKELKRPYRIGSVLAGAHRPSELSQKGVVLWPLKNRWGGTERLGGWGRQYPSSEKIGSLGEKKFPTTKREVTYVEGEKNVVIVRQR